MITPTDLLAAVQAAGDAGAAAGLEAAQGQDDGPGREAQGLGGRGGHLGAAGAAHRHLGPGTEARGLDVSDLSHNLDLEAEESHWSDGLNSESF